MVALESINTSRSSWITSADYDDDTETLNVGLKGREFTHEGVPLEVWDAFKSAQSLGSYYVHNILGVYG